ncbi:MAG: hypothetical protein PHF50_02090 [Patescibacteria group bacterium]|nr:hypothetical protein [Patescibacteria group bacterium]
MLKKILKLISFKLLTGFLIAVGLVGGVYLALAITGPTAAPTGSPATDTGLLKTFINTLIGPSSDISLNTEDILTAVNGLGGGGLTPQAQIFTSSGTWTKPDGVDLVFITMCGAGGGGGAGTYTSGLGPNGATGGNSSFGSLTAVGGGGGMGGGTNHGFPYGLGGGGGAPGGNGGFANNATPPVFINAQPGAGAGGSAGKNYTYAAYGGGGGGGGGSIFGKGGNGSNSVYYYDSWIPGGSGGIAAGGGGGGGLWYSGGASGGAGGGGAGGGVCYEDYPVAVSGDVTVTVGTGGAGGVASQGGAGGAGGNGQVIVRWYE